MRGKDLLECIENIDDTLIEEALNPKIVLHRSKAGAKCGMAAACVIMLCISGITFWAHQNKNQNAADIQHEDTIMDMITIADAGDLQSEKGVIEESEVNATDAAPKDTASTASMKEDAFHKKMSEDDQKAAQYESTEEDKDFKMELAIEEAAGLSYTVISDYDGQREAADYCYEEPKKGTFFCYRYLEETIEYYTYQENQTDRTDSTMYAYQIVIDIYGDVQKENGMQYEILYNTNEGNTMIEQEYQRLIDLGYPVRLSEDFQLTGTFTKTEIDTFPASPEYGYVFRFESES